MKIKVLKRFHDKETDKVYEIGEVVEVTDKRGIEIISNPLEVAEKVGGVDVTPAEKIDAGEVVKENLTTEKPKAPRRRK